MSDNWHDQSFVNEWDADSAVSNPTRTMLLNLLTSIVVDVYVEGKKILDLGFGTGLLEKQIIDQAPNAEFVCVDGSELMIAKAKERLNSNSNVALVRHDLNEISSLALPKGDYQFAITAFVLHEISADQKKNIFEYIYKTLIPGGIYILVDRFKIDMDGLASVYKNQWNWQSKLTTWHAWKDTFEEYKHKMNQKGDSPDSIEDQINWLRKIGFKAECVQLQLDRGLIIAIK